LSTLEEVMTGKYLMAYFLVRDNGNKFIIFWIS